MSSSPLDCWLARPDRRRPKSRRAARRPHLRLEALEQREVPHHATGAFCGTVFTDCDNDGLRDAGEPVLAGVTVTLTKDAGGFTTTVAQATTGADGMYLFENINHGTYWVEAHTPTGYLTGKANVGDFGGKLIGQSKIELTINGGEKGHDYDFGQLLMGGIGGLVWCDDNNNCVQDAGEEAIAGVTITLTGTDDLGNSVSKIEVTNAEGRYCFNDVRPGTYTVTEIQPPGIEDGCTKVGNAGGKAGTNQVTGIVIDGCTGHAHGYDFGEKCKDVGGSGANTLSGSVFCDDDNDGFRDAGEHGIAGVTITLTGTDDQGKSVSKTAVTGGDGTYLFTGLRPGTYQLTESQPHHYNDGKDMAGTPFGGTASSKIGQDLITNIVIPSSPTALAGVNYNFGEVYAAMLEVSVFKDVNKNNTFDAGEALAGVTITLTGTNDLGQAVSVALTTEADGKLCFEDLRPGTYTITETQPPGLVNGKAFVGWAGGTVVGPDQITGITITGCTEYAAGYMFSDVPPDVGPSAKHALSGFVYEDCDADGIFDGDEEPIAGVTVTLTGTDKNGNAVNISAKTDAAGKYEFTGLEAGKYTLTESQPAGFFDGKDTAGTPFGGTASSKIGEDFITNVIIPDSPTSQAGVNYNFGELRPSRLEGTVFHDVDADGVQDAGEAGIAGVTLFLQGTNDIGQAIFTSTVSGAGGKYQFTELRPGQYQIIEVQPPDWVTTINKAGTINGKTVGVVQGDVIAKIDLGTCESGVGLNYNFGEKKCPDCPPEEQALHKLGGLVFADCDLDGVFDAGDDKPIANAVVILTGTEAGTGAAVSIRTATDANGAYQFVNLRPGNYTLTEEQPAGYVDGKDMAGTPFGGIAATGVGQDVISQIIIPASATPQTGVNYNFTEYKNDLSGFVYTDVNDNGTFDAGESPIPGVTITLTGTNDVGAAVSQTAVTDAAGKYHFAGLRPGTYTLTESQPAGFFDGKDTLGTADGQPLGTAGNDTFTAIPIEGCTSGVGFNFGECPPASVSGYVYQDVGTGKAATPGYDDGVRQDYEPQIAGVTITLTGTDDLGQAVSLTTKTGQVAGQGQGYYEFKNLRPGTYAITETQPAGFLDGKDTPGTPAGSVVTVNDRISNVVLPCGVAGANNNFGELPTGGVGATGQAFIRGLVYVDTNCDGFLQGTEAARIAGVTIQLFRADDLTTPIATTTTDAQGRYEFEIPNAQAGGQFVIAELQPPNFRQGGTNPGTPFGGTAVPGAPRGSVGSPVDRITTIVVPPVPDDTTLVGENYNFGECVPPGLGKSRFLASFNPAAAGVTATPAVTVTTQAPAVTAASNAMTTGHKMVTATTTSGRRTTAAAGAGTTVKKPATTAQPHSLRTGLASLLRRRHF